MGATIFAPELAGRIHLMPFEGGSHMRPEERSFLLKNDNVGKILDDKEVVGIAAREFEFDTHGFAIVLTNSPDTKRVDAGLKKRVPGIKRFKTRYVYAGGTTNEDLLKSLSPKTNVSSVPADDVMTLTIDDPRLTEEDVAIAFRHHGIAVLERPANRTFKIAQTGERVHRNAADVLREFFGTH